MYERQKKIIDDFKPIKLDYAVQDSKKAADVYEEKVPKKPDSTKVEVKLEEAEQGTKKTPGNTLKMKSRKKAMKQTHAHTDDEHDSEEDERNKEDAVESSEKGTDALKKIKGGPRMKRQSKRKKADSDLKEEDHLKTFLQIVPDEEEVVDYEVLEKRFPIINWESKFYHLDRHGAKCIYYRIFRSDGSSRWIKTFSEMVTRFDRLDLVGLYNLVMQRFETTTPEGIDLVLSGDLRTMFDANAQDELLQNQEGWSLKSWDFYENCGVHTLTLKELVSPKQMALGKDFSNPLIVDSLLKTIWLSMHHVILMKHWLFQSKRLLGRIVGIQKSLQLTAASSS
ncbi:hypothetical protein Tco_0820711 [Tanacetum coccineum]|uniref:Uncharacterized protein n=1 Tax=Tanacetum coccineum TaxID=301880 RepID=A0ABQ5AD55_9ASTR